MTRYFFHLQDGVFVPDRKGTLLPSIQEARKHAIALSAEVLQKQDDKFWNGTHWQITATDETGATFFTLNFYADAKGDGQ